MNEESIFMEALQRQMPEGARCFPGSRLCNGSRRLLMRRALNDRALPRLQNGSPSASSARPFLFLNF